jgi:hypothetical protein
MSYICEFPSCCDIRIMHDVSGITLSEIRKANRHADLYNKKNIVIVEVARQHTAHERFLECGWKNFGRRWKARSGNYLQMLMYTPKMKSKR